MAAKAAKMQSLETKASESSGSGTAAGDRVHAGDGRTASGDGLFTRCFVMADPLGFHARPAALFVRTAQQFAARIRVGKSGRGEVNGKSLLGLLTLEILYGETFVVAAEGADAAEAIAALAALFADDFGQRRTESRPAPNLAMTTVTDASARAGASGGM